MTPMQSYKKLLSIFEVLAKPLGMWVFVPDYRLTICSYGFITIVAMFCTFCVYTIATYESAMAIQCATCIGVGLQGPFKIYSAIRFSRNLYESTEFTVRLYDAVERSKCQRLIDKVDKFALVNRRVIVVFLILITATGLAFLSFPAVMYGWTGNWYPVLPAWIPFVDETKLRGYLVSIVFQAVTTIVAAQGQMLSDGVFLNGVTHLWPMSDVIDVAVEDLNESLLRKSHGLVRLQFRNLLLLHKEFYEYTVNLSNTYYIICTGEVSTNALSMCTLIYTLLAIKWIPGYFLFLAMFGKLLIYCVLGTVNDRVLESVQKLNWYMMSNSEKNQYMFLLSFAQNPAYLMAGVNRMDMETFVSAMKSVYSVAMLLVQMVE